MKTNHILLTAATALLTLTLASCGSSKQPVAGAGDYEYMQFLAQKRAQAESRLQDSSNQASAQSNTAVQNQNQRPVEGQQAAVRPKRTLRDEEPTVEMALAESDCLRSFGEATGFVENAVMDQAILGAQERMSVLLRSEIETAASNYARNANLNMDNTSASIYESVARRFSVNASKNSRIIKRSVYDLDNGQVQIYVCIETRKDDTNLSKELANELSREGFLGLQFDRDRFAAQNEERLKEYRAQLRNEGETPVE